jgi:hypothetical protein
MKVNMLFADRVLRLVASFVYLILYFTGVIHPGIGLWLMPVAVVFFITSYTGFCPLYGLLGVGAGKKKRMAH